ncbi:MAG: hypothetical protein ACHQ7M_09045 [Chloroflexota bacterium]
MRTLLHLNPAAVMDVLRVWGLAAVFWLAHARLGRCPICHTALRVDDQLALIRRQVAHGECAAFARSRGGPLRRRPTCP